MAHPNSSTTRCMQINESPLPFPEERIHSLLDAINSDLSQEETPSDSQLKTLAVQTWRLGRRIGSLQCSENDRSKRQLKDSFKRISTALEEMGVSFEDPTGRAYSDGWLEVEPISFESPDSETPDGVSGQWVKQTIRPIVRKHGTMLCKGEIVVADPEISH